MEPWDNDFYDELSEFDRQINEFKQGLIASVKTEYTAEMDRLRTENAELQDVKSRMQEIEQEHKQAVRALEDERKALGPRVMEMRLSELMATVAEQGWAIKSTYTDKPKCDKCNSQRKIAYTTPRGREATEPCECWERKETYTAVFAELYRFRWRQEFNNATTGEIVPTYIAEEKTDYDGEYFLHRDIYNGEPFTKRLNYSTIFEDKAKAQEYCDWLNNGGDDNETT